METLKRIDTKFVVLFVVQLVTLFLFLAQRNQLQPSATIISETGKTGAVGPIGPVGGSGKDSISRISTVDKISTVVQPLPITVKGLDALPAKPCSVANTEAGVIFSCPDGSSAIIEKPREVAFTNGDTPEVRVENCQFQYKYPNDDEWTSKGNVCEAKDATQ